MTGSETNRELIAYLVMHTLVRVVLIGVATPCLSQYACVTDHRHSSDRDSFIWTCGSQEVFLHDSNQ